MADGLVKHGVPGRHMRRPGLAGLRRVCLATLVMLVAQYGLGIGLNLYIAVPAADATAGITQEIASGPLALTVHALLGLALIVTAIVLVARAVGAQDRLLATLAAAGLTAIGGAFAAGEIFVRNGQPGSSLAMAMLTGVALLCYLGTLVLTYAGQAVTGQRGAAQPVTGQRGAAQPVAGQRGAAQPVAGQRRAGQPVAGRGYPAAWPAASAHGFPVQENWHVAPPGESPASWFVQD